MIFQRVIERFTTVDGSVEINFLDPAYHELEWDSSQDLQLALRDVIGASYAHDLLGYDRAPKGTGSESVRFTVIQDTTAALNAEIDTLRRRVASFGRGKLWTTDDAGNRRWAWARPTAMPEIAITGQQVTVAPVALHFERLSDWYGEDAVEVVENVVATPHEFVITNPGSEVVQNAVFTLVADAPNGFAAPLLRSISTGDQWSTDRVASGVGQRLRVDAGRYAVEWSADGGTVWTDDYARFAFPNVQVLFMRLIPGGNLLRLTGATAATLRVTFYPVFS